MRRPFPLAWLLVGLAACSAPEREPLPETPRPPAVKELGPSLEGAEAFPREDLPMVEDNVKDDTMLIQTTHDLGDGTFLMVARNVMENREGLRMYRYRPRPDSTAEVLAVSMPAYDSEVMLPTFFRTNNPADGVIILANYGAAQSWGQNVFLLKEGEFRVLGWLDVALGSWKQSAEGNQRWLLGIGPETKVYGTANEFEFIFTSDSVFVYDDLQGGRELMYPSDRVRYRFNGEEMLLYIDGVPHSVKEAL